jgi:hypothetical protein
MGVADDDDDDDENNKDASGGGMLGAAITPATSTSTPCHHGVLGTSRRLFLGHLAMIAGIVILFWNERLAVTRYQGLEEALRMLHAVDPTIVERSHEGDLVHFSGTVRADTNVYDPTFGVSVDTLILKRTVEMYQWVEEEVMNDVDDKATKQQQLTTNHPPKQYHTEWSSNLISSQSFQTMEGHENPSVLPYPTGTIFLASDIHVGGYSLQGRVIDLMKSDGWYTDLSLDLSLAEIPLAMDKGRIKLYNHNHGFYIAGGGGGVSSSKNNGGETDHLHIGDLQVTYQHVPEQKVSILARQVGRTLSAYPTQSGESILLVERGSHTATAMLEQAHPMYRIQRIVLRIVGFVLLWVGLLQQREPLPLGTAQRWLAGRFGVDVGGKGGSGVAGILMGTVMTCTIIAISWLLVRPFWAMGLLVLVPSLVFLSRFCHQQCLDEEGGLTKADLVELVPIKGDAARWKNDDDDEEEEDTLGNEPVL